MEKLEILERRVPIIGDKALINLVNGIQVNYDLIRYQKQQGFFGKIFDQLAGADTGRRLLLDGNLIAGQQTLYDWILDLTDSLRISQVALEITQNSLLEARQAIRKQKEVAISHQKDISILDEKLNQLAHRIEGKIDKIEDRILSLELGAAAQRDFECIVTAWEAKQTYRDLPWVVQVFMLVKEVFSSSVAIYELRTQDILTYRKQLVNRILVKSEITDAKFFSVSDLLDSAWQQISNRNDLDLSLGLLETHTLPYSRRQSLPLLFTVATTLELAALDEEIRPSQPGRCAVELCRAQIQKIDYTTTTHDFITQVTYESANDSLLSIANYKKISDESD
jgi:hypothetical protein